MSYEDKKVERKLILNDGKEITFYLDSELASKHGDFGYATVDGQECFYALGTCENESTGLPFKTNIKATKNGIQYYILTNVKEKDLFDLSNYCSKHLDEFVWDTLPQKNIDELMNISVAPDARFAFSMCYYLEGIQYLPQEMLDSWDMSEVTSLYGFFGGEPGDYGTSPYHFSGWGMDIIDLSKWNTKSLEDATYMFSAFTSACNIDLSNWDVKNLKSMRGMFAAACIDEYHEKWYDNPIFWSINLSGWQTSNLEDMSYLFCQRDECTDETFQCIANLDTSHVKDISYMFYECPYLRTFPLKDISNVENVSGLFKGCDVSETDFSKLDFGKVKLWRDTFREIQNLEPILNGGSLNFSKIDTKEALDMHGMFAGTNITSAPSLDTRNVEDMSDMFKECEELLEVPPYNTTNVTNMNSMLYDCENITNVPYFDTSKVTDMSYMLAYCYRLTEVPQFNTSNVTDMSYMFCGCGSIPIFPVLDTSKVIDTSYMFNGCSSIQSIDFSQWNFSNVVNSKEMFEGCSNVEAIKNLHLNNTEDASYAFYGCKKLNDLSGIRMEKITNAMQMFGTCESLTSAPQINYLTITNMTSMFWGCKNLTDVSALKTGSAETMQFLFYNCTKLPSELPIAIDCLNIIKETELQKMFANSSVTKVTLKNVSKIIKDYVTSKILKDNNTLTITFESINNNPRTLVLSTGVQWNPSYTRRIDKFTMEYVYDHIYDTMEEVFDILDVSNLESLKSMFEGCTKLKTVPLFDTSNIRIMERMFYGCSSLMYCPKYNTRFVYTMDKMFYGCTSLSDVQELDLTGCTGFNSMFYGCSSLPEEFPWAINLKNVNYVSSVKDMFKNSSVTNVKLKNVKEEIKPDITSNLLKGDDSLTIEFID